MSQDAPIVLAEDVHRRFGPQGVEGEVLAGASLRVEAGELVALVGRSGSGKSTLLHILGGLDRDFTGRVSLFGHQLGPGPGQLSDAALSRLRSSHIGFVFQAFHLLDHLSCLENVLLPNSFADAPLLPAAASERAREVLSRVGLGGRETARPAELSGGQRQRVAIARALFFRPQLLLCDEPTGNLDVETGQRIIELFTQLSSEERLTLILVTHEVRVASVARRLLRMQDGRPVPATLDELSRAALAPAAAPAAKPEAQS